MPSPKKTAPKAGPAPTAKPKAPPPAKPTSAKPKAAPKVSVSESPQPPATIRMVPAEVAELQRPTITVGAMYGRIVDLLKAHEALDELKLYDPAYDIDPQGDPRPPVGFNETRGIDNEAIEPLWYDLKRALLSLLPGPGHWCDDDAIARAEDAGSPLFPGRVTPYLVHREAGKVFMLLHPEPPNFTTRGDYDTLANRSRLVVIDESSGSSGSAASERPANPAGLIPFGYIEDTGPEAVRLAQFLGVWLACDCDDRLKPEQDESARSFVMDMIGKFQRSTFVVRQDLARLFGEIDSAFEWAFEDGTPSLAGTTEEIARVVLAKHNYDYAGAIEHWPDSHDEPLISTTVAHRIKLSLHFVGTPDAKRPADLDALCRSLTVRVYMQHD